MIELLIVAAYILPVIGAAQSQRLSPFLAMLTFGAVNISGLWRMCAVALRRLSFGEAIAYDPNKAVHRAAAYLMLLGFMLLLGIMLASELTNANGGSTIALSDALIELLGAGALHLAAAFLGVGWVMRRRLADVLGRLCLRLPTLREAAISIAVGAGLWMFATASVAAWQQSLPADAFQQQTELARQYAQAFSGSLGAALLVAIVPAVSEEILYRGALQPIFGALVTSLFFTAIHLQYGLTPALLILFAVSLGFAWLRWRFHTSAAIIAHAVFNFLPFLARA